MKINEKYLETLKSFDDYVTVSEWAEEVVKKYPEILKKAEKNVINHKVPTSALQQVTRQISSEITRGKYAEYIKIDDTERPRRVKYISKEELDENTTQDIEEDLEPLNRKEIEKYSEDKMALKELYRLDEFRNIQKAFKTFFKLDFELDHAKALLNKQDAGEHHPDNFQLILKYHNGKKSNNNWKRFTIKEQIEYIEKAIALQSLLASRLDIVIDKAILDSILSRLKAVY